MAQGLRKTYCDRQNYEKCLELKKNQYDVASQNFLLYNGTIIKTKVNEWINN